MTFGYIYIYVGSGSGTLSLFGWVGLPSPTIVCFWTSTYTSLYNYIYWGLVLVGLGVGVLWGSAGGSGIAVAYIVYWQIIIMFLE